MTLWPETVQALRVLPEKEELVFYTAKGNPKVWVRKTVDKFGNESSTKENAGDSFAVQKLLGPTDVKMATTYVQNGSNAHKLKGRR